MRKKCFGIYLRPGGILLTDVLLKNVMKVVIKIDREV